MSNGWCDLEPTSVCLGGDTTPPVFNGLESGHYESGLIFFGFPFNDINIDFTVTDNGTLHSVGNANHIGGDNYRITINPNTLANGTFSKIITAIDSCGKTSQIKLNYTRTVSFPIIYSGWGFYSLVFNYSFETI